MNLVTSFCQLGPGLNEKEAEFISLSLGCRYNVTSHLVLCHCDFSAMADSTLNPKPPKPFLPYGALPGVVTTREATSALPSCLLAWEFAFQVLI